MSREWSRSEIEAKIYDRWRARLRKDGIDDGTISGAARAEALWNKMIGQFLRRSRHGRKRSNPGGGRKLTKLEKKVRAAKKAADRRVAVALAKYLRQENPGRTVVGAKRTRGKGGRITLVPIFAKPNRRAKR